MNPVPAARRALVAVILSGLAPGAGHFYLGRVSRGLGWALALGLSLVWWSTQIPEGLHPNMAWLLLPCLLALGLILDSGCLAARASEPLPRSLWNKRLVLAGLVLAFTVLSPPLSLHLLRWHAGMVIATDMSMAPLASRGDWIVHERITQPPGELRVGQLLVLRHEESGALIRRLMALPGTRVVVSKGLAYLDGHASLDHLPSSLDRDSLDIPELTVAAGELFVLADTRASQAPLQGVIQERDVLGEPSYILWPGNPDELSRLGEQLR